MDLALPAPLIERAALLADISCRPGACVAAGNDGMTITFTGLAAPHHVDFFSGVRQ